MNDYIYHAPYGELKIITKNDFVISLEAHEKDKSNSLKSNHASTYLEIEVSKQLDAYFQGKLQGFDLPYCWQGTEFQQNVWSVLEKISYGETISYGELACELGDKNYSRAVGGACGKNILLILVPCHRVIGIKGTLTGFAAGLSWKQSLLNLEAKVNSYQACLAPHH